jgi:hypothetical protein
MYNVFTKSGACVEIIASIFDEDSDVYCFYHLPPTGGKIKVAEFRKDSIEGWLKVT